jgi:DNA ligase-1
VGVSRQLIARAVAQVGGLDALTIAQRLIGFCSARAWPDAEAWLALSRATSSDRELGTDMKAGAYSDSDAALPYPFFLAQSLQADPSTLGSIENWLLEWKWDGIRVQLVRRRGEVWLWSRGEELISEQFPEVCQAAMALPDGTVIDGELLAWDHACGRPLPFTTLGRRLGRRTVAPRTIAQWPVRLLAYDLLERDGVDWRARAGRTPGRTRTVVRSRPRRRPGGRSCGGRAADRRAA